MEIQTPPQFPYKPIHATVVESIGSMAIEFARSIAYLCNRDYIACQALTGDADIEYDPNLPRFYEKNGFKALQNSRYRKKTKTRPMYANSF